MGGFLSEDSLASRLLSALASAAIRALIEPVVTSLVFLRDHLEQSRFVVRPISAFASLEEGGEGGGGGARLMQRSATTLSYHQPKLLEQQQQVRDRDGRGVIWPAATLNKPCMMQRRWFAE